MSDAPLMLGVSGLRGIVGQSLTPEIAWRYGMAIGQTLQQWGEAGNILIGRDSRPSGPELAAALAAGLAETGTTAIDMGICSTPAVGYAARQRRHAAIVLTASHNPTPWNGVKIIRAQGTAPTAADAQSVIDHFHALADRKPAADPAAYQIKPAGFDAAQEHAHAVAQLVDQQAIRDANLKVVVDSVCGAGGAEARTLLDQLNVSLVHLHSPPTGDFPHEPEPTEQNLTELAAAVTQHQADAGMAQDPDADRLALVDNSGRYIGEECTLALAVQHLLKPGQSAVANLSTSRMIDDLAQPINATIFRSPVGEANVAEIMRQENAALGGEGNGGVIDPRLSYVRDSLLSIALTLDLIAATGKTLAQLRDELPAYTMQKEKVPRPEGSFGQIADRLAQLFPDARIDRQDGIRFDFDNRWLHVRPSNTEPILRFIAEAPTEQHAAELTRKARSILNV
ncbi:phosphoglucosamine mutase [Mucisphaera calidilacus]|uniref:Phosphomannomutase/phosphoglucomutase n=1 Tax=Mucisphaera calidilacus TaxID=2527982 RepID=A0A518C0R7_9BACT|nr:phosphoglucosamine mutase [Mucisphaera calidilacus]QDU72816.1 Phosphomannomutase/phosphoglucomutase [Mucisphaera calidilacus]